MENKLSSVEGQRVMQVLEETTEATRLVSCITPAMRSFREDVADLVGQDVTALLMGHIDLLEDYNDSLNQCGGNARSKEMLDITLRVQDSVRTLSRLPSKYPLLVDKLMVLAMDQGLPQMIERCVHTFEGLKHLTFQKLITTVEEENSRHNFLSGIERKEQQKQKERKDLETKLKTEKDSRQKEVKRLTDQRDKLMAEIDDINSTNANEVQNLENSTRDQEEQNTKDHNAAVERLTKERDSQKKKLEEMVAKNLTDEKDLRGRKQSFYSQVTKCIEEYDTVMTEKKTQHERRQKMHEDDLRQIQEYVEYFEELEKEKAAREELERIEAEKRAAAEAAMKVFHDAAAKIQALFRGLKCRKPDWGKEPEKGKKGKKKKK
jgi:DNA repair exonuclease SbcCD ATPase subunit